MWRGLAPPPSRALRAPPPPRFAQGRITKTTSTVKLFKGDENISNNNKKNTEKDIVELFGDYNLLNSICISLQDGVNLLNTNDK